MKNKTTSLLQALILIALLYLFFTIIKPFLASIVMALVFAVVFHPLSDRLQKLLKINSGVSAFLTLLTTLLIIIFPIILLIGLVSKESIDFVQNFRVENVYEFFEGHRNLSFFGYEIDLDLIQAKALASLQSLTSNISSAAIAIAGSILNSISSFFVFLILYFYFLKDKEQLVVILQNLMPYDSKQSKTLVNQFYKISKTVFFSTTLAALVAGTFATIGFYIFGLANPLVWGLFVTLFSLIPTIGSLFIYLLGIFVAFIGGGWQMALGLAGFYLVFDLIVNENIIKPKLLDDRLAIHPIMVFFAIVGGVNAFGAMGILYGPIIIVFLGTVYAFSKK